MIVKQEAIGDRVVAIVYSSYNRLWCVELVEPAPEGTDKWLKRADGTVVSAYHFANNRRTAEEIFSEWVTVQKMKTARRAES